MKKFVYLIPLCVTLFSCEKEIVLDNDVASIAPKAIVESYTPANGEKIVIGNYDFTKVGDNYLIGGDVLLTQHQVSELTSDLKGAGMLAHKWAGNSVPYVIASDLPNQARVIAAINHLAANTDVCFVPRTNETDYVKFIYSADGTYSYLGKIGGGQPLGLADWATVGNVVHEMCHSIGIFHEQSRTDRDNYITINWSNIQSSMASNFSRYIDSNYQGFDNGSFDFSSLMLYPSYNSFAINTSLPTMTKKDGTTFNAQRNGLSSGDIAIINIMYPPLFPFDLKSSSDKIIMLNYNGDVLSDLMFYRPGSKVVYIEKAIGGGSFSNVFSSSNGIAGYDFNSGLDQAVSVDFNGDGKDDILTYRPGSKIVYVAKSNGDGSYTNVYASANGIAGYDFSTASDKAISLDFNGDGKDDILTYRPGQGIVYIAKSNGNGTFTNIFASGNGIAGYDFRSGLDQAISLDFNGDGKDDILTYRPGSKIVYVAKSNGDGSFTNVYASAGGIAGYDFSTSTDQAISLDYNGDGKDDIITYRPGSRIVYVARSNGNGTFTNTFASASGIAGYDFADGRDRIIALNYNNDGKDDIICYRPGTGTIYIMVSNGDGSFKNVYYR